MDPLVCPRHPDTETYLRCSSCETPICPGCSVEAAIGYQCPDCAGQRAEAAATAGAAAGRPRTARTPKLTRPEAGAGSGTGDRLPPALIARAVAIGTFACVAGGFLLGPVLQQGTLFLISSGAIGWGVARATFWGANEVSTPVTRALALAFAGATAAVGLLTAGGPSAEAGMLFLAYPAALYGGWIVVRRR
jgi:hypothetical protein